MLHYRYKTFKRLRAPPFLPRPNDVIWMRGDGGPQHPAGGEIAFGSRPTDADCVAESAGRGRGGMGFVAIRGHAFFLGASFIHIVRESSFNEIVVVFEPQRYLSTMRLLLVTRYTAWPRDLHARWGRDCLRRLRTNISTSG